MVVAPRILNDFFYVMQINHDGGIFDEVGG